MFYQQYSEKKGCIWKKKEKKNTPKAIHNPEVLNWKLWKLALIKTVLDQIFNALKLHSDANSLVKVKSSVIPTLLREIQIFYQH